MATELGRREFLQATMAGGALCVGAARVFAAGADPRTLHLVSPGCRRSKVRVGKIYMAGPQHLWPTPKLDLNAEVQRYEAEFTRLKKDLADVEFVGNTLVTSPDQVPKLKGSLAEAEGILAIHLGMGVGSILAEVLSIGRPTVLFAAPYSGHEWTALGAMRRRKEGALLECLLTSDFDQLAVGVRPFRAIHHLREAKIINVTGRPEWSEFVNTIRDKLGTEIKIVGRERILEAYESIDEDDARAEADRWITQAEKVVEPSEEEIVKSCRLALAFEKVLDDEDATVMTVDCYGTMFHKLPAFPCIGFTRLNNMGLGGICESDLQSAMTHVLFQGLVGRPGFISDPTMDVSKNGIILAHCLGTTKMDGPGGVAAPYRLRTIMERQEGAVPQVRMRVGQKVTQAKLIGADLLHFFTGEIIEAPDTDRGCRTKITVRVDGDADKLWQNWSHGLHRVTCYGDLTKDLERFCRFKGIRLVNEGQETAPTPA